MKTDNLAMLLEWCIETGADECIGDAPVDRFAVRPDKKREQARLQVAEAPNAAAGHAKKAPPDPKPDVEAEALIANVRTREELHDALVRLRRNHSLLALLHRTMVFADGNPEAAVMIVGEAPGAEEDRLGKPFVGRAGGMLDRMFVEVGLERTQAAPENSLYITNILNWRPPGNRNPTQAEMKLMTPFVSRHIELVSPKILVLMGGISCSTLLGVGKISQLRGKWHEWRGIPVMPMFHPAFLLRNPIAKREAWIDLLLIRKRLLELQSQ